MGISPEAAIREESPLQYPALYNIACVHALKGNENAAMDALEHAIAAGNDNRDWIDSDSDFDAVRTNKRFQELISRLT